MAAVLYLAWYTRLISILLAIGIAIRAFFGGPVSVASLAWAALAVAGVFAAVVAMFFVVFLLKAQFRVKKELENLTAAKMAQKIVFVFYRGSGVIQDNKSS